MSSLISREPECESRDGPKVNTVGVKVEVDDDGVVGEASLAPGTSTWGWKSGGRPRAMRSFAAVGV